MFVNGHGGNITPYQQALFELKQEHRDRRDLLLLGLTYWDAAGSPAEKIPGLVQKRMGHACEWETSMVLRLNPKLVVGDVSAVPEVPFGKEFAGYRAWVMPDRSEPGTSVRRPPRPRTRARRCSRTSPPASPRTWNASPRGTGLGIVESAEC